MNNLLDYNLSELTSIINNLSEPKFRADQLYNAILNGKNYSDSTVLPNSLLDKLKSNGYNMQSVKIHKTFKSKDNTVKFLYKLNDDNIIEGVLMEHSYGRTLCVSTQVGCKMNCSFCASGLNFVRNLTPGEILGQIVCANTYLSGGVNDRKITNLVLMGSGEPLDNFDNVVKFLHLVTSEDGFNFSVRNITLSTCGIPSKIERLADIGLSINLAISLHAPNDEIRKSIMPVAKSFPIKSVIESAKYYYTITNRMIYIEYTLIDNVNSSLDCARELANLLKDLDCRVNLITLNSVVERGLKGIDINRTNAFCRELNKCGISATIRQSKGNDIDGACGQLRNKELGLNGGNIDTNMTTSQNGKKSLNKANNTDMHSSGSHNDKNKKSSIGSGRPRTRNSKTKNSYSSNTKSVNRKDSYKSDTNTESKSRKRKLDFEKSDKPSYKGNSKRYSKEASLKFSNSNVKTNKSRNKKSRYSRPTNNKTN